MRDDPNKNYKGDPTIVQILTASLTADTSPWDHWPSSLGSVDAEHTWKTGQCLEVETAN